MNFYCAYLPASTLWLQTCSNLDHKTKTVIRSCWRRVKIWLVLSQNISILFKIKSKSSEGSYTLHTSEDVCPKLSPPENGSLSQHLPVYGQTAKATCNDGYRFADYNDVIYLECLELGIWNVTLNSSSLPYCRRTYLLLFLVIQFSTFCVRWCMSWMVVSKY